jgi:quercetin dioxygenase-like cupin family protein
LSAPDNAARTVSATVFALVEVIPNGIAPRHTHPEIPDVLEGNTDITLDGEAAKRFNPGDSIVVPAGISPTGHAGPNGVKLLGTYVVEKDKPLTSPVK